MTDEAWISQNKSASDDEVAIDFIKAPNFRISWVDGALGAITPSGNVHVTLYAERPAIPRRQVFKIDKETSTLGDEIFEKRLSRDSIVREMSTDMLMSADTAEELGDFLIKIAKELRAYKKKEN